MRIKTLIEKAEASPNHDVFNYSRLTLIRVYASEDTNHTGEFSSLRIEGSKVSFQGCPVTVKKGAQFIGLE